MFSDDVISCYIKLKLRSNHHATIRYLHTSQTYRIQHLQFAPPLIGQCYMHHCILHYPVKVEYQTYDCLRWPYAKGWHLSIYIQEVYSYYPSGQSRSPCKMVLSLNDRDHVNHRAAILQEKYVGCRLQECVNLVSPSHAMFVAVSISAQF